MIVHGYPLRLECTRRIHSNATTISGFLVYRRPQAKYQY